MSRMWTMSGWTTAAGHRLICASEEALATLAAWRQGPNQAEAGGILLGTRRGRHFEVLAATPPFSADRRTRNSFFRSPVGHQERATQMWQLSGGTTDYLGEWHSHPESSPTPSHIDIREWRKIALAEGPRRPILTVIVGTQALAVQLVNPDGSIDLCSPLG
jgi:integrative and conjugative element protein (TIGR02256 family)